MIESLESELRARIDAIRDSLSPQDRNGDTLPFLSILRDSSASNIRQAPAAAQRALAKTRNPDIGIAQLVQVVEEDPTLGQALLRYANSAYYATGGVVVSLRQAAQRVGTSGVHNVVLGVMLEGMLCKPGGDFQAMVDQVRAHLVRTAPLARAVSRGFALPADECYAVALLHDAGKLIIFDALGTLRHEMRRDLKVPRPVVARLLCEVHEPLGGLAALRWGLGERVATAIATHHRRPVPAAVDRLSEVLFVAERADHAMSRGTAADLGGWWNEGGITADRARVEGLLEAYSATEMAA